MSRYSSEGVCEACQASFRFFLIDTRANASAYAYCDACGTTALLSGGPAGTSAGGETPHGPVPAAAEARLSACACGGCFRAAASPRCPECRAELSAVAATPWIEAKARRRKSDWRWQGSWHGDHCIVIENRLQQDDWKN